MDFTDRIKPTHYGLTTYLDMLIRKEYQIPTFQRNVVWDRQNVKKLWDSIYKFYPLGSILVWKTNLLLQNHRSIGGWELNDSANRSEFQYILDGQQRTTSLLTSLYGGEIKGKENFDPTIFVDITIEQEEDTDDESYKRRFLFWDEIDDRNGDFNPNIPKMNKYNDGLIIKLNEIKSNMEEIEEKIEQYLVKIDESNFRHPYRKKLRRIRNVLDNYRISMIELKGIQVQEVCQIFERINQAGKPLDIFDIVVAKTFRPDTGTNPGFYLRDLFENFKSTINGEYSNIDDLTLLQMIAVIINNVSPEKNIKNITEKYLNDIKSEYIEEIWDRFKIACLKLFDFFDNILNLKGPALIPFRYFYLSLCSYFFENDTPDYNFLTQYFWYYSLHDEDLLSNTTHLWRHIELLNENKNGNSPQFERFYIDKNRLRNSSYSSKGTLSRAILSFYAFHEPKDWANPSKSVLLNVYYLFSDKPNLHHIFPLNYIQEYPGSNKYNVNSLMNIAYLPMITNIRISDSNPIKYIKQFDCEDFRSILKTHLIPLSILDWAEQNDMPQNALDLFIEDRIEMIINRLKKILSGIEFDVVDTRGSI